MNVLVNLGSGPVDGESTYENALKNTKQFIKDCEVKLLIKTSKMNPDDSGRYSFVLLATEFKNTEIEVLMPGLPLEKVRYMDEPGQCILDFPRIYVNENSWIWKYAILTNDRISTEKSE